MEIPVLLTCVGSQISPSAIQTIRNHPKYELRIIGIDTRRKEESVGAHFSDEFYQVPMGSDPDYAGVVEDLADKRDIKVILPGSDEEALTLSKERSRFLNLGCVIACPDYEITGLAINKYRSMVTLRESHVPVAEFYEFSSLNELLASAEKLGFPEKPFVIKPKVSRGGRGFRLVQRAADLYENFLSGVTTKIDFDSLKRVFEHAEDKLPDFFVMDYLPGKKYSTDILARDGQMEAVVIRNKIFPVGSPTQMADIVFDEDLIDYATSIMEVLEFNYFVQFEIGRNQEGKPRLIEINPRLDATLPICLGIGINFYHEIINHALGEEYSEDVKVIRDSRPPSRFFRYWQHCFVSPEHPE